jgi:hypothetical protein
MKLPEYDNRPPAGTPLYTDSSKDSSWDDIKFPVLAIGLPLLALVCFWTTVTELIAAIKAFFH